MYLNGAMSFDPRAFTVSAKSETVLLLFGKSGKKYVFTKGEMQAANLRKGANTFLMTDMTDKVSTLRGLKEVIGI